MILTIVGNCQAAMLALLFGEAQPEWDVRSYMVHTNQVKDDVADYAQRIARSDIIVMQPIHDGFWNGPEHCSSWIRANARADATILMIPSLFFMADHPGLNYLYYADISINVDGRNPYLYVPLAAFAVSGLPEQHALDWLLSPDAYTAAFLDLMLELAINEQKRREEVDAIDILITPFYQDYGGRYQLFHTLDHPARPVVAHVVDQTLAKLGFACTAAPTGTDYLASLHLPVLPSVRRYHLARRDNGATFPTADDHDVRIGGETFSQEAYLKKMVQTVYSQSRENLQSAIDGNWLAKWFLDLYAQHHGRPVTAL